jgi:uncharacterized protein (DUF433 family)
MQWSKWQTSIAISIGPAASWLKRVPGKVSGRPVVRGTRILADTIVQDAELGSPLEEIQENYPDLSLMAIQQLISFARSHRVQRVP